MKSNLTISTTLTALTLAAAFTVQAADLHVPADYATIQEAVDAASNGDTIHIAPGVYAGQTTITEKKLSLIGQPGAILRAVPGMARIWGSDPWVSVLGIRHYSDVDIRGLTFEGERLAVSGGDNFSGVLYFDSAGSVEECRFTGFRVGAPEGGFEPGNAIDCVNDLQNAPMVNVRVVGNTFVDTSVAIRLVGAATNPSINFTITDNTIIGPGPVTGGQTPYGILIQQGTLGEVKRNSISNMSYVGTSERPFAIGILAINQVTFPIGGVLEPILFEENTFRDNQMHIVLLRGDGSTITNNTIIGTAAGLRPAAILVSGENVTIAGNRFSQMPEGIRLMGDDPEWGTQFGIADDVQLIDNRFCEVANPINMQPLATATEQGTLLCPFPEPVLDIASAVLLSWPEFEDGYVVESAPAPDGPWTPLDATPFLEAGQTRIAVATTGEQQYFRLRQP
jgi:nitrous oxidase accessory protein NosD